MIIRPMQQDDVPIVSSWLATIPLWQRYQLTRARAETNLAQGLRESDILLVADMDGTDGQACGVLWCVPKGAFGRSPYVRLLGVRQERAGCGIGAVLLQEGEQYVAQSSPELFLLVSDFNTGAQRFYQREGYQQVGAIPGYVLPDVTEFIYWKQLQLK